MECKCLYLSFALCLFLSGCGASDAARKNESYTLSDVTIAEQTDVAMEVQQVSPSGGTLAIHNAGEKTIGYGTRYIIEKNVGGIWYSVNIQEPEDENAVFSWLDILYRLESGKETTLELQWDYLYGFLPEGHYRLVKNICYPDYAGGKERFNVAAYFEITQTGDCAAGTINSSDTISGDAASADTAPPEEEQAVPATVAAYLSAADALWRSDQEHADYRTAYGNESLDQHRAVNLEKDYNCEIILSEDFAETGDFTLSLSVDGTDDGLYVLEGNQTHASIVFGEAYRLGNILYLGTNCSEAPPFALNLETKTLTDCKEEFETLQRLYADYLQCQPENTDLYIQCLHPMAQVDSCLIYLATISETTDTDIRAVIYAAFDEFHSLRAYLLLTEADYLSPGGIAGGAGGMPSYSRSQILYPGLVEETSCIGRFLGFAHGDDGKGNTADSQKLLHFFHPLRKRITPAPAGSIS